MRGASYPAGIEDDQDVAVAPVPLAHLDEVLVHPTELGRSGLGDIVGRAQAHGVQELAPGRAAGLQDS